MKDGPSVESPAPHGSHSWSPRVVGAPEGAVVVVWPLGAGQLLVLLVCRGSDPPSGPVAPRRVQSCSVFDSPPSWPARRLIGAYRDALVGLEEAVASVDDAYLSCVILLDGV